MTKKSDTHLGLERWERLAKTDPAHTKSFSRGGFKGTALKPIWLIKRMTEEFGTAGEAWGMLEPKFETIFIADVEPQVYCTAGVWIGHRDNTIYGVGGDTMVRTFKNGESIADDEAFKKAYTDAINNCFKYLGIGGDVHMGQFDDSKYVQQVKEEFEQQSLPEFAQRLADMVPRLKAATTIDEMNALMQSKEVKADIELAEQKRPASVQALRSAYSLRKRQLEGEK